MNPTISQSHLGLCLLILICGIGSPASENGIAILPTPAGSTYFRLSNGSQEPSYIISTADPLFISQGRQQIQDPLAFLPRILIGTLSPGDGGFNRDFSSPLRTPWSWHVNKILRFAEVASQMCDGSPELVEDHLGQWLNQPGMICFWNYRIIEELSPTQVSTGSYRIAP